MVEVSMGDDEVVDPFQRDIHLAELAQEGVTNPADAPVDNGTGFSLNQIEVEKLGSQEVGVMSQFEWKEHEQKITD
jgi:hypothetical protein